jgi:replicative DNA helicase
VPADGFQQEPLAALDAERAVCAAVLMDASTWWLMVDRVAVDDFYDPRHRLVWEAFATLIAAGKPVDRASRRPASSGLR